MKGGALGDELKRILGREDELEGEEGRPKAAAGADAMLLFHPTRKKIFEVCFTRPCCTQNGLARQAGVSPATAKYHLDLLLRGGLVSELRKGKNRLFYPTGLLGRDDIERSAMMEDPRVGDVYRLISGRPGLAQKDLAGDLGRTHQSIIRAVSKLIAAGQIRQAREGRHVRYFPESQAVSDLRDGRRRLRAFRERLLLQLRKSGFVTRVHRSSEKDLVVSMEAGEETVVLHLSAGSPFAGLRG